jgi:RNA recognition motif-containing protein
VAKSLVSNVLLAELLAKRIKGKCQHNISPDTISTLSTAHITSLCRFAFIDFATEEAVAAAVAKSESDLNGRALLIKDSKNYEKTGRPKREPAEVEGVSDGGKAGDRVAKKQKNPPSPTVFVGNLSFNTTREAIQQQFEPCGRIRKVRLATFQDSGKCKG